MDLNTSETMSLDDASSIFSSEDGEYEQTDHMKKVDQQHRLLIDKIFRPILRDRLVPTNLLRKLRIIKDKRPELMQLDRSLPRHQVVDKLLDFVVESQQRHWFESFLEGLQDAGYVELMKLVSSNAQIQKKETFHLLMQHCYDLLLDEASPEELLMELFDVKVLDEDDANEIANTICDEGSRSGMSVIICRMALHSHSWFQDFKTALESTKKFSLVEKLDRLMVGAESDGREGKDLMNDLMLDEQETQPKHQPNITGAESSIVSNDRVPDEEDEDAAEPAEPIVQGIQLRSYQLELVDGVIGVGEVKNSLIVAPTGCGKTIVAAEVIKRQMEKNPESKVLFLVPTVALVQQQFEVLKEYPIPGAQIKPISGETSSFNPLKYLKMRYNIMVMTPQILVNACDHGGLSSFGIGLMIFDECHHSMKDHPYSKIMALYHDIKAPADRPRIVGMTASVGVGKAKNEDDAVKHIICLLANMDAHLVTVQDFKTDLAFCVNIPQENLVYLKERNLDPFYDCIRTIMEKIETKIENYYKQLVVAQARLGVTVQIKPPTEKGSLLYKQWYSAFANKLIVNVEDDDLHRDLVCFADYLKVYNDTLLINFDCRSLDALKFLEEKVKPLLEPKDTDARFTDTWLAGLFMERVNSLQLFCDDPSNVNPKLIALKENILKKKKEGEPMRCIVFCQTREICSSLVMWANATEGLVELKASFLTGSNAAADKKGLTSSQQNDVIKAFAHGQHQLIFATTVAEEGLDIQACDNVIRYQYVSSMTARIQSRGRARKSKASFTLLASSKEAQRDEMNSIREEIQTEAIGIIMKMDADIYDRKLREEQRKQQYKRKMGAHGKQQELQRERGRLREQGVDYTLVCRKCLSYATPSDNLRVIENIHHVVISEDFIENVRIVPDPEKKTYGGWEQTEKMLCVKCGEYWGPRCRYLNRPYPVIKIEQFIIMTPQDELLKIKKWKECPFYIEKYQLEMEDV